MFRFGRKKKIDPTQLAYRPPEEAVPEQKTAPVYKPPVIVSKASIFDTAPSAKTAAPVKPKRSKGVNTHNVAAFIVIVLAIGLVGGTLYSLTLAHPPKLALSTTVTAPVVSGTPAKAVLGVIDNVRKKAPDLPTGENPSVATVTDPAKLSNQPFFAKAQKGDEVLIYPKARKAYLYRRSTDQIVQEGIAEVITDETDTSNTSTDQTPADPDKPVLKVKF